ncbi:PEF-CTERM sorting domain-containing protein [Methanolobus sp. ZRKC3]|uniref:PEF-CTERM sorting domain-containing protein n=1 Tax=Methanolobus sp. ZRKC3 TaxID=3125786 RepID=UPI003252D84B
MDMTKVSGGMRHFYTEPYYSPEQLEALEDAGKIVQVRYEGTLGPQTAVLKVSHYCPIPEFPAIAIPIAAIIGLAFFFQRRKE